LRMATQIPNTLLIRTLGFTHSTSKLLQPNQRSVRTDLQTLPSTPGRTNPQTCPFTSRSVSPGNSRGLNPDRIRLPMTGPVDASCVKLSSTPSWCRRDCSECKGKVVLTHGSELPFQQGHRAGALSCDDTGKRMDDGQWRGVRVTVFHVGVKEYPGWSPNPSPVLPGTTVPSG